MFDCGFFSNINCIVKKVNNSNKSCSKDASKSFGVMWLHTFVMIHKSDNYLFALPSCVFYVSRAHLPEPFVVMSLGKTNCSHLVKHKKYSLSTLTKRMTWPSEPETPYMTTYYDYFLSFALIRLLAFFLLSIKLHHRHLKQFISNSMSVQFVFKFLEFRTKN